MYTALKRLWTRFMLGKLSPELWHIHILPRILDPRDIGAELDDIESELNNIRQSVKAVQLSTNRRKQC